jgi:transcriptional regulator with XRE-family HTH domain
MSATKTSGLPDVITVSPPMPTAAEDSPAARLCEAVGERLELVRLALGFPTTRKFAEYLGVNENTPGSYERGKRFPSLPELLWLKHRTGYSLDFLVCGDEDGLNSLQKRVLDEARVLLDELTRA